jgi:hypothetical protein
MEGQNKEATKEYQDKSKEKIGGEGGIEMCPMASMCKGMVGKPGAGNLMLVPGTILILVGILILIEPRILLWLIAGTSIIIGIIMFVFGNFMRKMVKG